MSDRRETRPVDRRMRLPNFVFHVKLTLFTRT